MIPKAFISYSHDTQEHKRWVFELANRLRNNGIDASLDQWDLRPGDDIPHFMETHLASADKIIMVCTEKYVERANKGEGGVGYEKMIITSNLMKSIDENKIIPLVRQTASVDVPTFLRTKLYINFSVNDDYEFSYDELVRTIHNSPLFEKPPVGNNPFRLVTDEKLESELPFLNIVLRGIIAAQGPEPAIEPERAWEELDISPGLFKVAMFKLERLGYTKYSSGKVLATMKGLLHAYENKWLE